MDDEIKMLQLGKNGVTDSFVEEACAQLKKSKVLKVRILKSAFEGKEKKDIANEVALKTRSQVTDQRGNTFILKKR